MNLERRIARLEAQAQAKDTRCATCQAWPDTRVVFEDPDEDQRVRYPATPERCLDCGWEPTTILVTYGPSEPQHV